MGAQTDGTIDAAQLQGGAQGVHKVHQGGLTAVGTALGQGPHVGQNDVPLLVGQLRQLVGVAQGGLRVVKALPAGVGRLILGVIQIQVMEQARL